MADDVDAIANLKSLYCATADLGVEEPEAARSQFAGLFTADFSGDFGMMTFENGEAITDFLTTVVAQSAEWMVHMLGSPRIIVDGDTATGDWTVLVWSRRVGGGEPMRVIGRYSDSFRRTADGWRISRIGFKSYQ
jgi:hypothetical protein